MCPAPFINQTRLHSVHWRSFMATRRPRGDCPRSGGLTLVPLPGFEGIAGETAKVLRNQKRTPTRVVVPRYAYHSTGEPFIEVPKEGIVAQHCIVIGSGPGTF